MARWKARVEFLLRVIERLFLSLMVEALQDKMCQNSLPSGGVGQLEPRFQGKGSSHCQYIDTTRKAIDGATTLPMTVFSERELTFTFAICYRPSVCRLSSVCLSSVVCNARAPYSGGSTFRQDFYGIRYLGHPLTSTENFTEIVPGKPLRRGS